MITHKTSDFLKKFLTSLRTKRWRPLLGLFKKMCSLSGNVGTMKEKDTITPLARGKPNRVLTQVLTEARREAAERLRRTQEMKFIISTNIEEVLFKGRVRVNEMKLNDFLTRELGGSGVVDSNRDVLLEEFFKDPTKYIRDKGALNEIQASGHYLGMKRAVKGEVIFDEDIRKLCDKGVDNLPGWSIAAAEVKATVHNSTKHFLDAAAEEARYPTTTSAPEKLEGCYESVHNARWSHAVELPDGVERMKTGTGMGVHEGKPEQSWSYKKADDTIEENDAVQQFGAAPPVLMVLASEKGWPYSWNTIQDLSKDVFVICEVERVWQIVKGDLTAWFSPHGGNDCKPERRVLIGTPGIGNSVAAGSYLLYQLLHCDAKKNQVAVHCFGGGDAYVSDKTTRVVTRYGDEDMCILELRSLRGHGRNVYIIYDVAKEGTPPPGHFAPTSGWGMIAVSFPKVTNYDEWAKQLQAARIIVNCPDEMDVKAMCAWMTRDETKEKQAECWKEVKNTCIFWDRFHVTSLMRRRLRTLWSGGVCIAIDQRGNCERALFTGR
ncbi:putative retrotransposon hot spot protein (RHS) [Trypanosoma cruzi]|uniref:Putative retrotransposon hot spot protein (RHS) n=1 Tax=Trypanosoma cruzi TaxID=5693 RepID=A0A2V2XGB0_TRYCR|nr:putative retrotransposon hot spot protein (RHS) [Trypanosoma cruzi]RNC41009.1 putative retrotransposon hot spot (RHS) protein [Trypanosoma cruzi]